ncbi:hypothetical protein RB196_19140 [Streptomyces sp. PmtA]|uniref:hypothetical protein n=1 Tax=Streptomyces sp. PmtA TaxID=3074275 RepID=UPI0030144561
MTKVRVTHDKTVNAAYVYFIDPKVVVGVAARQRRQVRFLAKRSLWERPAPVPRSTVSSRSPSSVDGSPAALNAAVEALWAGHCVCAFPEGTLSRGRTLRVRSGAADLVTAVPETRLIGCAVTGARALASLRHRPRVRVVFLPCSREPLPANYKLSVESVQNSMRAIRAIAPPTP